MDDTNVMSRKKMGSAENQEYVNINYWYQKRYFVQECKNRIIRQILFCAPQLDNKMHRVNQCEQYVPLIREWITRKPICI